MTSSECPVRVVTSCPVAVFQILAVLSSLEVAASDPSAEYDAELTQVACPFNSNFTEGGAEARARQVLLGVLGTCHANEFPVTLFAIAFQFTPLSVL
jgi:hypothetical protein